MAAHSASWEHCKHAGGLRATSADVFVAIYHCLLWFYLYIYILLPSGITSINTLCLKNMCWFFYQLQRGRTMLVLSFEGFLKFIFCPFLLTALRWAGLLELWFHSIYKSALAISHDDFVHSASRVVWRRFSSHLPCLAWSLWIYIYILISVKLHHCYVYKQSDQEF